MKINKQISSLEILIPMILGDGYIRKKKNAYFEFCHSYKQKEYALWKLELLKRYCSVRKFKFGDKKHNPPQVFVRTSVHHKINSAYRKTYENGKKVVKNEALKRITPLSLAIWYMDDGTALKKYKTRKGLPKKNPYIAQIRLCTHSFSFEENNLIKNYFRQKFGLNFRIYRDRKFFYLSCVGKNEVNKFIGIVQKYMALCPSMLYKITI